MQAFSIWGVLLANQNSCYRKNQKEHRCVVIEVIKVWLKQEEKKNGGESGRESSICNGSYDKVGVSALSV